METLKKRDRFVVEPRGVPYRLTDYKISILQLLQRRRYLPTSYIHAYVGGGITHFKKVLTQLRHEARLIDARWVGNNALYQEAVYHLNDNGYATLKEHGLFTHKTKADPEKMAHELGVNLTAASFELGVRDHGLELISAQDILNHPSCPVRTRHLKDPFSISVAFDFQVGGKKHRVETQVESDGEFFGVARRHNGGRNTLLIPGFEFDRRTEPLEPEDYNRPSIKRKFLAYRQLAREGAYEARYGFPEHSYVIPFITINEAHMHALMRVLENVSNGKGSEFILFKAMPPFATYGKFPPPTGHMLTEPWLRVGYEPMNILDELK